MMTNPGGTLAIDEIVGRDELIAGAWETLAGHSLVMTAERRIGKTSIVRKMTACPPSGWFPIFQDLERVHTADQFASEVHEAIVRYLGTLDKLAHRAMKFLKSIGGVEVGGVVKLPEGKGRPWKDLLAHSLEDLVTQQSPNRVVFFWDEMPYMLHSIRRKDGEATAMEILDVLRSLRQGSLDFRMVLTGSIGLHHVLTELKKADYRNSPVNDMFKVEVPPLARKDAEDLARRLLAGEGLTPSDRDATASAIAREGDDFPFYIHHIVKRLKLSGGPCEPDDVARVVREQLVSPNDPWELRHYRDRLRSYYPGRDRLATEILDHLAVAPGRETVDAILAAVKARMPFDDREGLLDLLKLLELDHYLARDEGGRYAFRFPLIRRWWAIDRGLA